MTLTRTEHGTMRRGKLSGTHAKRLISGNYKTWNTLLRELRNPKPFFDVGPNTPAPLRWGSENERHACALWWERHPHLDLANPVCVAYREAPDSLWPRDPDDEALWARNVVVSPDRMIYDPRAGVIVSGFELKCPYNEGKLERWRAAGACPSEHYDQCAFGQLVTNLRRWVFCAFDPRLEEDEQLFETLVPVPEGYLQRMHELGTRFLRMLESGDEFQPVQRTASRFKEMFSGQ